MKAVALALPVTKLNSLETMKKTATSFVWLDSVEVDRRSRQKRQIEEPEPGEREGEKVIYTTIILEIVDDERVI